MSIGNTKDNGNKGNNFPYQHAVLELLGTIATNSGGPSGPDYELITYNYTANKNGIGYSTGDFITRTQVVTLPTGVVILTLWFNQTTGLTIAAPPIADIDPLALATTVTVTNLPATLGQKPMANSLAVTIANDQSSIPVTNPNLDAPLSNLSLEATQLLIKALLTTIDGDTSNLDVLLSTRNAEATQLLIKAKTDNIDTLLSTRNAEATQLLVKAKTDNLDVLLSTRATESTLATRASEATLATMLTLAGFQARINTLGQKTMINSTPVVLSSDQSAIPITPPKNATATLSNVPAAAANTALLAANTNRNGAMVFNDSSSVMYLNLGGAASSTTFTVRMTARSYYEVPFGYTGAINGRWVTATGAARVTEITT